MNATHFQNQRIKLLRQIAKDTAKLAKWQEACKGLKRDIERAERLLSQVERKLER